jgi:hypothetical protein
LVITRRPVTDDRGELVLLAMPRITTPATAHYYLTPRMWGGIPGPSVEELARVIKAGVSFKQGKGKWAWTSTRCAPGKAASPHGVVPDGGVVLIGKLTGAAVGAA